MTRLLLLCLGTLALMVVAVMALASAPAAAQTSSLDLGGDDGSTTGRIIQLFILVTVL